MTMPHKNAFFWTVQTVLAFSLAFIPLVAEALLSEESAFHYAASEVRALPGYLLFGALLIFSPQIGYLLWVCARYVASSAFFAVYGTRHGKVTPVVVFAGCYLLLAVGVTNFILGGLNLGFSIAREVKYATSISRGRLIELANLKQDTEGIGSNLAILQRLTKLHPDYYDTHRITNRINDLENARSLSNDVMLTADRFADDQKHIMAVETYKASIAIWPNNVEAKDSLSKIRALFTERSADFRELYDRCHGAPSLSAGLLERTAPFILRNAGNIGFSPRGRGPQEVSARAGDTICRRVIQSPDGDHFISSLMMIFRSEGPSDESL